MATPRLVCVGLISVVICAACGGSDGTSPSPTTGPVRSLVLNVTPTRLPHAGGPVDIDLRATSDPGLDVAPDAVRLVLVIDGRESVHPIELDEEGTFRQRLFLSTPTIIRATGDGVRVERSVTLDPPPAGQAPSTVPPPAPPPPGPVPSPPRPGPDISVNLSVTPLTGTTATTFTFTASAVPLNGAGPVVSYDWDEDGDGAFEVLGQPNARSFVFATAGSKTVGVRANSSTAGVSGTDTAIVTVTGNPSPPLTVTLDATPSCVILGGPMTFTATPADGSGRPLVYDWDFDGDGTFDPPSTALNTRVHVYTTAGTRTARVRLTTTTGEQATGTRAVTVRSISGTCP